MWHNLAYVEGDTLKWSGQGSNTSLQTVHQTSKNVVVDAKS
jgi:hypothetical protein